MKKLTILLKLKIFNLMIALKIFFPAPSTDDRRDFEIKVIGVI